MEQAQVFKKLLEKYLAGNISAEEKEHLEALLASNQYKNDLESLIDKDWEKLPAEADSEDPTGKAIYERVLAVIEEEKPVLRPVYVSKKRIWAAASIAAVICIAASLYWINQQYKGEKDKQIALRTDVAPGGDKAILTLANGNKVVLDSSRQGIILRQSGITIQQMGSGQVVYNVSGRSESPVEYNTITTPPGGQFQVVLPDGSKVWLNSCSSLRFPTDFRELERNVELRGEGYFEIAESADKPFSVGVNELNIQVLGTRFNVMAYPEEENIRTTLLQGSVQLWNNNQPLLLKPGEEGRFNRKQSTLVAVQGNEEEALAWKNGYFSFENADFKSIIRHIGRWYDLEIVYESPLPDARFMGMISRNGPLSGAMKVLKGMGVNSRLDGKKLIIMPKD